MRIPVDLGANSYDIIVERGALKNASRYLNLGRKALIVSDSGVPAEYADTLAAMCKQPYTVILPMGEQSKSLDCFALLLKTMLEADFTRGDLVVAVGGGVVGDLAGFAAASYMRGIDFYNVPTTMLSQIDSSIGGKTAINFGGVKNIVGAFYQPRAVLIDPDVLKTLPKRQMSNGLAEAVKMALTSDKELFELFEKEDIESNIYSIIISSLNIKKAVVEEDEKEAGLRRILNFGHTVGHGIEVAAKGSLYHGECVALGMLPMCGKELRPRLEAVLKKLSLPTAVKVDTEAVCKAMLHDKKAGAGGITVVKVDDVGKGYFEKLGNDTLTRLSAAFISGGIA